MAISVQRYSLSSRDARRAPSSMGAIYRSSALAGAILGLVLTACGDDGGTEPDPIEPGVHVVAGADVTDTIETQPLQALVVEVRQEDRELANNVVVQFQAQPHEVPDREYDRAMYVCALSAPSCGPQVFNSDFAVDTTGADGRAAVMVRLGRVAGAASIRITVPELGMSATAHYTVLPGAPHDVRASIPELMLNIGGTATVGAAVVDRAGNERDEVPTAVAGAGTALTVTPAGQITGIAMGTQKVYTQYESLRDSTTVRVLPSGRLVVWSNTQKSVKLVNLNGTSMRTLLTDVGSDLGVFPRFDASRQRVSLHTSASGSGGSPGKIVVLDTSLAERRDIVGAAGFAIVVTTRRMADGTVLVVGRRAFSDPPGYSLWRVETNNDVTLLTALPGLGTTAYGGATYGGADISHDGTRVVYTASGELRLLTVAGGATQVLAPLAIGPRFSSQGDRVVYLVPPGCCDHYEGIPTVINTDGTGKRPLGTVMLNSGVAWSPDGVYVVGRSASWYDFRHLLLIRVSDAMSVQLRFPAAPGEEEDDFYQPDWR